jgi:SH3-like domain-containing protein
MRVLLRRLRTVPIGLCPHAKRRAINLRVLSVLDPARRKLARMRMFSRLPLACVLCLLLGVPTAFGQTLQLPAKQNPPPPPPPKPPAAAPREPVHQVGKKPPPVVQPHGTTHAQKPVAKAPAAGPVVPPVPVPPPAAAPLPEPPKQAEAEIKGSNTGLPLPRFASLRSDEVNLRAGPGTRYPIDWIYKRRDLPVEILREFEVWRLVQDPDGIKGWVHQATLTGRRSFVITGGDATLRREAQDSASAVAVLKKGVIGHVRSCAANSDWCQVQAGDYRGYLKRGQFWGALPAEAVAN